MKNSIKTNGNSPKADTANSRALSNEELQMGDHEEVTAGFKPPVTGSESSSEENAVTEVGADTNTPFIPEEQNLPNTAGEAVKEPVGGIDDHNPSEVPDNKADQPEKVDLSHVCQDFHYNGSRYCMRDGNQFIPLGEGQVKKHLMQRGLPEELIDDALCYIRIANYVEWMGSIAGYNTGIHIDEDSGRKFLVTRPPAIIHGVVGDWGLIRRLMEGLFDDPDHPDQFKAAMAWNKQARENVKKGKRRPLPALAMVGPINAGKTLALEIFRMTMGGRSAPAYRALINEYGFNSEIVGAELLTVDDQMAPRDPRARVRFGQAIKSQLFTASMRVEAKHRNAITARPVHALAIALNDEPQHVHVLPEMDDSLEDKISLMKTGRARFNTGETDDREELMRRIREELPAFIDYLESYEIPEHLRDSRTGARAWQHPAIVAMLEEISPEGRLFELIQQCNLGGENRQADGSWRGASAQIQHALMEDPSTKQAARHLINWNGAVGTYMRRLIDKGQAGVSDGGQRKGIQTWVINLNQQ